MCVFFELSFDILLNESYRFTQAHSGYSVPMSIRPVAPPSSGVWWYACHIRIKEVTHKGQEMTYDWSNEEADTIEWAGFYSDCEHEVKRGQSRHRVILAYNLYIPERLGGVLRRHPAVRPNGRIDMGAGWA